MSRTVADSTFDIFLSFAGEDRESVARPLVEALRAHGFSVWYDESAIGAGDDLQRAITTGIRNARYGVIVISRAYFEKDWPRLELMTLWMHETRVKRTIVFPVLHGLTVDDVTAIEPAFGGRAMPSMANGVDYVVDRISVAINRASDSIVPPVGQITPTNYTWWSFVRDVASLPLNALGIAPQFRGIVFGIRAAVIYAAGIYAVMLVDIVALFLDWRLFFSEAQRSLRAATFHGYVWSLVAVLTLIYVWVRLLWSLRTKNFTFAATISVVYAILARCFTLPLSAILIRKELPSGDLLAHVSEASILVVVIFGLLLLLGKAFVRSAPRRLQQYVRDAP